MDRSNYCFGLDVVKSRTNCYIISKRDKKVFEIVKMDLNNNKKI
jgi:hypothetical protein